MKATVYATQELIYFYLTVHYLLTASKYFFVIQDIIDKDGTAF